MPADIRISHLTVCYKHNRQTSVAVSDLSLELEAGGIYCLIGPSGCGKSTLLHTIGGIIKTYEGEVTIDGKAPDPKKQSIGLVPQSYGLLPWETVKDNVYLASKLKKIAKDPGYDEEIIRILGLHDLLSRYPGELSGGQKQRTALARTFIQKPDLLLMDEPFSALDTFTADKCRNLFLEIWKRHRVTTLFVTHNLEEAVKLGRKIIFLSPAPARVLKIIDNPLTRKGADRSPEACFRQTEAIREIIEKEWE